MGMHEGLEWPPERSEPNQEQPLACDVSNRDRRFDQQDDLDA
jgi:hypothetical protein